MAKVDVKLDYAALGQILVSGAIREPLRQIAEKTAARARSTAPVDTGAYRDRIGVESDMWRRGVFQYAIERVVASDPRSMAIESRTSNLKRALGR